MDCLRIIGGQRLAGSVSASGAKNAALPILATTILASEPVALERVPRVSDVDTLALLLGYLGVEVKRGRDDVVRVATIDQRPTLAEYELVSRMRASFCVLGPLLARRGRAVVSLPGGCNIGSRPVDLHLRGLAALGADIRIEHGYVIATARRLRGAEIDLSGSHGPTVTGTANVMSAAALASGRTTITGAAREPEVVDLGQFLNTLGASIVGLGTDTLEIDGRDSLGGGHYQIIPDRIEAGTLLLAGALTGGRVTVNDVEPAHLAALVGLLREIGCRVDLGPHTVTLTANDRPRPFDFTAAPYPGVPTDLQPQLLALAALADGTSTIRDSVFPDRFLQVDELARLGATIERREGAATVRGVARLTGAQVTAGDLRASAALVLAGLAAEGETVVRRIDHLDRGYERLAGQLAHLGSQIERNTVPRPGQARSGRRRQSVRPEQTAFQSAGARP